MKVYLRELLEDRIQVLEKEIFKNSNISSEDLSMDEMQDLEAKIFDQKRELVRAKKFYFKLDEIDYTTFQ